jgi:hypothetical protein
MLFLMLGMQLGAADTLTLVATDWPPPRRAESLVTHKPLGDFLLALEQRNASVLRIRHAGGESGSRFAERLRDALVALGLPANRIRLVPAAADSEQLILEFSANGEPTP